MKALVVNRNGILAAVEKPLPEPRAGTVRVRVEYAGVGFADMMAVSGGYALAPRKPFSPGYEFMGSVETTGQRVAGMLPHMACYQEYLDIDPVWAVPVPDGLAREQAAALPLNHLTAWALLQRKARLKSGQSFLIHGAAGGVGSATLELARHWGLRAFGTVSAGKEADVEALGATPIRRGDHWLAQARELEPQGFGAAFDSFGGALLRQSYASLEPHGILVSYGFAPTVDGGNGPFFDGLLFHARKKVFSEGKRTAICGVPSTIDRDRTWYRQTLGTLLQGAAEGRFRPKIHDILPWNQAGTAHQLISAGKVRGKLLLKFS